MGQGIRAIDSLEQVAEGVSVDRLDYIHDLQQLLGVVIGTKVLLEVALNGTSERARVGAAKQLSRLDEDPEELASRLRSAPFSDLDFDELEAIVQTGELDPEAAMEKLAEHSS